MHVQSKSVYFLGDAHLGSGPDGERRGRVLAGFLSELRDHAEHVYLLGDVFDFWFEYRSAIPKGYFNVLHAIAGLVDASVPVDYLGGNHDFWAGSYLKREVGVTAHSQPIEVSHQGRRIFLAHGDGLGPGDFGYRLLKAVLRSRLAIGLYKSLHPDLGIPLAHRISATSRKHARSRDEVLRSFSRDVIAPRYVNGADAVIVGHVHEPIHLRDRRGRDFIIAGDWIDNMSWARLAGGKLSLERLDSGGAVVVPSESWPEKWEPKTD